MKEDQDIDQLFDPTFNGKDLIKSAQRKSYVRITGVSLLVSICVLALLVLLKLQLTPYLVSQREAAQELYYEIYGANTYTGAWTEQHKLIGSSATAPKYKLVNGKPVYLGEVTLDTSSKEVTIGNSQFEQFTYVGNRVMNFFHPSLNYTSYENDLNELSHVADHKWIEMGLSFDRDYTYEEVVSMLPKDVTLQWSWVNDYSNEYIQELNASEYNDSGEDALFTEWEVAGFSSISKNGEKIEDPVNEFIETLEFAQDKRGPYKDDYQNTYETLKQGDASLTTKDIKVIGVVVVGDKQQLSQMLEKDYIKASSFGAIIDKY